MSVESQIKKMGRVQLMRLAKEEGIKVKKGLRLNKLRSFMAEAIVTDESMNTRNKLYANLTDRQLIRLAKKIGVYEAVKSGQKGWQLKALILAHCVPSTHLEARQTAERFSDLVNRKLKHTDTPRLHYAKKSGGVESIFGQDIRYYPGKFGEKFGAEYKLRCFDHEQRYSECNQQCRVGVKFKDEWAYLLVKPNRKKQEEEPKVISRPGRTATPMYRR